MLPPQIGDKLVQKVVIFTGPNEVKRVAEASSFESFTHVTIHVPQGNTGPYVYWGDVNNQIVRVSRGATFPTPIPITNLQDFYVRTDAVGQAGDKIVFICVHTSACR